MTEYMPPVRPDGREKMCKVGLDMEYDMWAFMVEQGRICLDDWRVRRLPVVTYAHNKFKIL